ncbi:sensor histidine kinase [Solicola gregarius]|uniref:histidine kinase n=1 Tax=Solicola gregarius TaxID=2908642 RepID=A0AA46YMV3_9ACTN|nr:histidine kinase [Solicola gregarius]UYM06989.1 histidine kinase [Solicola gregarius]
MRFPGEHWLREHPLLVDLVVAGILMMPSALAALVTHEFVYALDVVMFGAIIFRRTAPVASFGILTLALVAQVVLRDTPQWGDFAFPVGLYAIAAYGPTWARWTGLGIGFVGAVVATDSWGYDQDATGYQLIVFVALAAIVLFSWTLGDRMRTRRAYVAELEERAVQLEREAEQQARIAAAAERARIAREMHDVVAHSLSVIVVQADGALFAARKRPEAATETLATISQTGRESLAEMRRLIGLLRGEENADVRTPMPGGADLPNLVDQVAASGVDVGLAVDGELDRLGSGAGLTVYRVVQEALTNTLKHGGPDVAARVRITVDADGAHVVVDDDGRGVATADDGNGHGIAGMRERIAVHDGTIVAGPRPGGGFRVDARIPLGEGDG